MLAGSVASMAVIGAPDLMGLTATEYAALAARICRAGDLSLVVDADDGFGNAINVMRTVEEMDTAGVAALTIEDTELPLPFGSGKPDRMVSLEEGVGKMRAALAARGENGLLVIGRTSAAALADVDEAVRRLKAYAAAGVDAVFPVGVRDQAALARIAQAVDVPLMFNIADPAMADTDMLAGHGVRIALHGHAPFAAAVEAVYRTMKELRDGVAPSELSLRSEPGRLETLTREERYQEWCRSFLS